MHLLSFTGDKLICVQSEASGYNALRFNHTLGEAWRINVAKIMERCQLAFEILIEALIAFVLIFVSTFAIYTIRQTISA